MGDDAELGLRLLLCALVDAGGQLTVSAGAAKWVDEQARGGVDVGYATEGHGDAIIVRLLGTGPDGDGAPR